MAATHSFAASAAPTRQSATTGIRIWLVVVAALVFVMVLVGGATRLTESGLSITQWKPVTGVLPPLGAADWQAEFDRYKQIPQFSALNSAMTLDGFKTIFWWEWGHRLLARIVGAVFIIPALWFWARGQLKGALGRAVLAATGLLALEPIVGWWMVSSGLSQRTEVAQERLALHLLIAAGVFGALIYAFVSLERVEGRGESAEGANRLAAHPNPLPATTGRGGGAGASTPRGFAIAAAAFAALVYAQLGLGALVAGLRAGLIYNEWPLMGPGLIPGEAFPPPWPRAPFDDPTTAQFDHRMVAYAIFAFALIQAFAALQSGLPALGRRGALLAAVGALQVALGVLTLLFFVPISLALAHQAVALVLFGLAVAHWRATQMERAC